MKYLFFLLPILLIVGAGCNSNAKQAKKLPVLADSPKITSNGAPALAEFCYVTTAGKILLICK